MIKYNYQSIKDGDYHKFCEDLKGVSHLNFKCYGDYDYELKNNAFTPTNNKFNVEGKINMFIRHDIDQDLLVALEMAEIENFYGIRSTFFILLTGYHMSTWMKNDMTKNKLIFILKKMEELGHEIGFHYDMYGEYFEDDTDCSVTLNTINFLRDNGITIKGCAAHSAGRVKKYLNPFTRDFLNWTIWKELNPNPQKLTLKNKTLDIPHCSLKEYDLKYEAYFINKIKGDNNNIPSSYITDGSGFFWYISSPADKIPSRTIISPHNLVENIIKIKNTNQITLLTHPHMWVKGDDRQKLRSENILKDIENFNM